MKKMLITVITTGFLGIAVLCIPSFIVGNLPKAGVINAKMIEYCDNVSAVGEVQKGSTNSVTSDMPMVVDKLLVKEGDYITVGQPILTVNKNGSVSKMMEMNNYASLATLGAGSTVTSYEELLGMIPETLTSTVTGTIDNLSTSDGSYIIPGTPILTVLSSDSLMVSANILEQNISEVKVGQQVIITGSGFGGKEYHGVVEEISNVASKQYVGTTQQTFVTTKIKFTDADSNIRIGYSANVKILTSEKKTISVLPYESVMQDNEGKEYVYVFNNGIAVRKDITTGVELGEGVEVVDGISKDDKIIHSDDSISDGDYVNLEN